MAKKINRNDPCPCGSNKKYKQCCLKKEEIIARHTPEGKFKFSASVLSSADSDKIKENFTQLFQKASSQLTEEQKEQINQYRSITKSKVPPSKKSLNKAKAKEERIISEKLKQYDFQMLSKEEHQEIQQALKTKQQKPEFSSEVFIPTQEDYRVSKMPNSLPKDSD